MCRRDAQEVLPPAESQPWFDFNGLPLKWCVSLSSTMLFYPRRPLREPTNHAAALSDHRGIPTGVLYDMFVGGGLLPWTLTVRPSPSLILGRFADVTGRSLMRYALTKAPHDWGADPLSLVSGSVASAL